MSPTDPDAFRFAGLWQWNPVSCVTPRSYDEKRMAANSGWFFDRAFMSRYFDALREAGLNTWVLANTHPFPFMVDLSRFPEAQVLGASELQRHQSHYHWLFETARAKGLQPFVLFHTCYVPDRFGEKHQIRPTNAHAYTPPPLAVEYTRHCVRLLCDTYPELAGINGEASENVAVDSRAVFARDAVVAGIHDSGHRPLLFFRGWVSDPAAMKSHVLDVYEGDCFFTVKYTWEFLVHRKPDPEFMRWVEICGAPRVLPEFWISNYQPFGCHDTGFAAGIRAELRRLGCPGFTSHPMDLYGAPFVQPGESDVLQVERDRDWFATLSGRWSDGSRERAADFGLPAPVLDGAARAAGAPSQRISCFLTGNKQNFLQPQLLAAIGGSPDRKAGLHTLFHWGNLPRTTDGAYGRWLPQLEGTPVRYPTEPGEGFRLENLLEELEGLDAEWREPPAEAPLQPALYAVWRRDVRALRGMAQAWAARGAAIVALCAGRRAEAPAALERSLASVQGVRALFPEGALCRLLVGRFAVILSWADLAGALERELADCRAGTLADYYFFGEAESYVVGGKDFAERRETPGVAVKERQ
jgi:hypothetical protein